MKPLPADDLLYVTDRAARALPTFHNAVILITGASGFVGSWLAESAAVVNLNVFAHRGRQDGDIRSLVIPRGVTHVIHCANAGSEAENVATPDQVCDMIAVGTYRVAAECARVGATLLLMSSGSTYAPSDRPLTETDPTFTRDAERSPFSSCKALAEDLALEANPTTVIARGFAMTGPRLGPQFAAAQFVQHARAGGPITVTGSGATVRSYLYAADVAAYLWHLLAFGEPGQAYNVGSDQPCTVGTLACHTAHTFGLDVDRDIRWGDAPKDAAPFVPNTAKLRHLIGADWQAPLTPLEGLERWRRWLAA